MQAFFSYLFVSMHRKHDGSMVDKSTIFVIKRAQILILTLVVVIQSFSCVCLFVTSWAVAPKAPLSMGFPRQEYYSKLPFPSPGYLPDLGIEPVSYALQEDSPLNHQGSSMLTLIPNNYFTQMATHCSILAWEIPWTEEPGGLQSIGSQRVRYD